MVSMGLSVCPELVRRGDALTRCGQVLVGSTCPVHGLIPVSDDERYAEGRRKAADCPHCGSPIWIVYHGPNRNHTVEPRQDERDRYREALEHVVRNCSCQPSGQTCDLCHPALLALNGLPPGGDR